MEKGLKTQNLIIQNQKFHDCYQQHSPHCTMVKSIIQITTIENLRGNVNTRLRKLNESNWHGAIFAAAGLERINLRPENSVDLDWMLPAPAQGAIMVVCRKDDEYFI